MARARPLSEPLIAGLLLAGGRSRRMGGGDKCLRLLAGRTLLARAIARARPQVSSLTLSVAGNPARFHAYGLPTLTDSVHGQLGPLAGILAGLERAAKAPSSVTWLASFPTDAPFFPRDLVRRLADAAGDAEIVCARSYGRLQPLFSLWSPGLAAVLRRAVVDEGVRQVDQWIAGRDLRVVDFAVHAVDPFFNINAPEDLVAAEGMVAGIEQATSGEAVNREEPR